jgi:hypothetical protein
MTRQIDKIYLKGVASQLALRQIARRLKKEQGESPDDLDECTPSRVPRHR